MINQKFSLDIPTYRRDIIYNKYFYITCNLYLKIYSLND